MSPNQKPLIDSFFEVADKPGVTLVLDKAQAIDIILNVCTFANVWNPILA